MPVRLSIFLSLCPQCQISCSWKYTCLPIYDLIKAAQPDGDRYSLEILQVFPESSESAVDEVQFRRDVDPGREHRFKVTCKNHLQLKPHNDI